MEYPLVQLHQLTKEYEKNKTALSQLNLTLERGRIIGLLGPNGSGKTTLIKLLAGLLQPTSGTIAINGQTPGVKTKSIISYLPDQVYFPLWMKTDDLIAFFADFYPDFDRQKAISMLDRLSVSRTQRLKAMSKGTLEKVQLVMVMSRQAQLYLMDEPIAGVDPAARDFILNTILTNYNEEGTVLLSTHLIGDIERVLDEVVFLQNGRLLRHDTVDHLREQEGMSVDHYFREQFRANPWEGGSNPW